jgi:hypothetical protein
MKRKGYIVSLFVFLLFLAVFLLAVTIIKSNSLMQESNYERISIMKASRISVNVEAMVDNLKTAGKDCDSIALKLDDYLDSPYQINASCASSNVTVVLESVSGDFSQTHVYSI